MAIEDKTKWNKRYQENERLTKQRDASLKLKEIINQIDGSKALDVACGVGRNSIFLAESGFDVDAVDISEVAIEILDKRKQENITTKIIDLDNYTPPKNYYDLIVMTNFLDRDLISLLKEALNKNGFLVIETYMHHSINTKPSTNPDFLLKENELKTFFDSSFQIIDYDEFNNDSNEQYLMRKQSIIAKKL